jgi:hypothetical protein
LWQSHDTFSSHSLPQLNIPQQERHPKPSKSNHCPVSFGAKPALSVGSLPQLEFSQQV